MSLFACEVYIMVSIQSAVLVMNLEEDERFVCVWLLYLPIRDGGTKISIKSSFMEIVFLCASNFLCSFLCASNRSGKLSSVSGKLPTLAFLSWEDREGRAERCEANHLCV